MVAVWLWVGVCGAVVIPVAARLSLSYGGLANLGEAVSSGGASLQGSCFYVARSWMWRGPHEYEVLRCLEGQDLALLSSSGRVIDDYGRVARG